jgi:branched-chain amino acid transport system ATP-binding protein
MGLLGPNGSGKTTALNLMSGVLRPDAGSIRLMGKEISGLAAYRIARLGLARTFQLVRVLDGMDCRENIKAGLAFQKPHLYCRPRQRCGSTCCWTASVLAGQDQAAGRPTSPISTAKRLELARALAAKAAPVAAGRMARGLEIHPSSRSASNLIRSLEGDGITIVLVEHVMNAVRALCDRCVVMSSGRKIAEGATADVLSDAAVVKAYLGGVAADA